MASPYRAIILLGPTGSGKTPLGETLAARGLVDVDVPNGVASEPNVGTMDSGRSQFAGYTPRKTGRRRCEHFDFGQNLRTVANDPEAGQAVSAGDLDVVRRILASGDLLEDSDFPLAERLLESFLVRRSVDRDTYIILNGIPRHLGQAVALDRLLRVERVVLLECPAETVVKRIASDTGGDRAGRTDDTLPEIQRKLDLFQQRTVPLLDYYHALGVPVLRLSVGVRTSAEEMWQVLCRGLIESGAAVCAGGRAENRIPAENSRHTFMEILGNNDSLGRDRAETFRRSTGFSGD